MIINTKTLTFHTKKYLEFIDITDDISTVVDNSNIQNGLINICSLHTTVAVVINEHEPLLLDDFINHLTKFVPKDAFYNHNDTSRRTVNLCETGCDNNGHSHCLSLHLPTNQTLNIVNKKLSLGHWQRIFLVELDHARTRQIQLQIIGQ